MDWDNASIADRLRTIAAMLSAGYSVNYTTMRDELISMAEHLETEDND